MLFKNVVCNATYEKAHMHNDKIISGMLQSKRREL